MQQVIQRDELLRWPHARPRLCLQTIHPANDTLIKLGIQAHGVVHTRTLLHQSRQNVVDITYRKRIVGQELFDCTLRASASSVPGLA